jgi:hypothetical protein
MAQIRQNIPLADTAVPTTGKPSHVESVRLVTAPAECAAGVKALFAPDAAPGIAFTGEAYVFALDTVGYVVVAGGGVKEYTYFDARWKRVAVLESLD